MRQLVGNFHLLTLILIEILYFLFSGYVKKHLGMFHYVLYFFLNHIVLHSSLINSIICCIIETLIRRVRAVHDVIKETAAASSGVPLNAELDQLTEQFLSLDDYKRVEIKLKDLLTSICDYCNERLASLISTQSDNQSVSASQINQLSVVVENFTDMCESISSRQSAALKAAFKIHAGNYIHKFHNQRKTKLTMLLDAERWKPAEVPSEIQTLVDKLALSKYIY